MSTETTAVVNGVNVEQLFKTMDAVRETPAMARFRFRIRNEWLEGGYNRSMAGGFQGAGQDVEREQPFIIEADEPPVLLGKDRAANPVEYLLHALAACVTSSMVYHAAARNIHVEEVESTVEGDIDLRGFLGLDDNIRKGYQGIRMSFRIKADVTGEELEEICRLGPQFSPVFDSVTRGVPVTVTAEPM